MTTAAPARTWTITVDDIPPGPNQRLCWQARNRLTAPIRDAVAWQVTAVRPAFPVERAHVAITLYRRMGPPMDPDNAVACCKALIDGLVRGGLLADDRRITLEVKQERGERRGARIVVEETL